MKVTREELFFEPRCVNENGMVRWYGMEISHPELRRHFSETVYVRDGSTDLYIYHLKEDEREGTDADIKATFSLICRIAKGKINYKYGRKIKKEGS